MNQELIGVLIGAFIGFFLTTVTAILNNYLKTRKERNSIKTIITAEIETIRKSVENYKGNPHLNCLAASTPLWTSIANQLGSLNPEQAVYARMAITSAIELKELSKENEYTIICSKVEECIVACDKALSNM